MAVTLTRAIPMLRSFDEARAKEFYLDFLGFDLDWEHRFEPETPLYMQVSRGDVALQISEHHGDGTPGAAVFVEMAGIKAFHAEITAKNYRAMRPGIVDAPWGAWLMQVIDPFGNKINFNEMKPAED
ncbi:MAG: glyoxalase superfamily protein [Rhizobiaceae bacterium]